SPREWRRRSMAEATGERLSVSEPVTRADQQLQVASQWQLIRWRFTAHKLALVSLFVLCAFYFVAFFAEFVAPYDPYIFKSELTLAPPQQIYFVDNEGSFHLRPFVYPLVKELDPVTFSAIYTEDRTIRHPLHLFVHGDPYEL